MRLRYSALPESMSHAHNRLSQMSDGQVSSSKLYHVVCAACTCFASAVAACQSMLLHGLCSLPIRAAYSRALSCCWVTHAAAMSRCCSMWQRRLPVASCHTCSHWCSKWSSSGQQGSCGREKRYGHVTSLSAAFLTAQPFLCFLSPPTLWEQA